MPAAPAAVPSDRPETNLVQTHVQLGRALLEAGRLPEAMQHLVAAVRLGPDNHDAFVELGRMAVISADRPLALKAFREAAEQTDAVATTTLELARAYCALGQYDEARDTVARRTTPPGDPSTERDLRAEWAVAAMAAGDFDVGNAALRELLAENDSAYRALEIARFFCQQGLFDLAESLIEHNRDILNAHLNNATQFDKYRFAVGSARSGFAADARRVEQTPGARHAVVLPLQDRSVRRIDTLQDRPRRLDEPLRFESGPGPEASASAVPDDFDGLLSEEIAFLYGRCRFGTPQWWRHRHRFYVLPDARLSVSAGSLPNVVVNDRYYVPERMNIIDNVNFLHRAVLTESRDRIPAAFILPSWDRNHYHTLCCSMGTLAFYRELDLDIPIVFPESLSSNQRALLESAGLPIERAVEAASLADTVIETAYVPESMPYHWTRRLVEFHRDIARRLTETRRPGGQPGPEYLYLSRVGMAKRPLANEAEVEDLALSFGFRVVHPEELSYPDQVMLFAGAKAIMSPHGAGLANFIYSQPHTTIIELTARQTAEPGFCRRAHVAGHRYFPLLGDFDSPAGSASSSAIPWRIDTSRIARLLEKVLP